ncbi:MAG: CoA pyrophosphatase [Bacteroidetes bacterium]|nr:MAG: CoA pyrophosphatase [Bacteroidota bacterium]
MDAAFIRALAARLGGPLPGRAAQQQMASRFRSRLSPPSHARSSGVLMLLYPHEQAWQMVFMKRTADEGVHSGQVSFPGGRREPGDKDLIHTALREAEEELGIPASEVEVLGQLTELYIAPSNFLVYPSVGYLPYRPAFQPDPAEVAEVIEAPLSLLLHPQTRQMRHIHLRNGLRASVPAFWVKGHAIWGATAMMLNELLELLRGLRQ